MLFSVHPVGIDLRGEFLSSDMLLSQFILPFVIFSLARLQYEL